MAKRKAERRAGPLVIIGGAEDRQEGCDILREFLRLAGGKRARRHHLGGVRTPLFD